MHAPQRDLMKRETNGVKETSEQTNRKYQLIYFEGNLNTNVDVFCVITHGELSRTEGVVRRLLP